MNRRAGLLAAVAMVVVAVPACGTGDSEPTSFPSQDQDFGHVHALVQDEDDALLAATHNGLFVIGEDGPTPLGEDGSHDLMGMAQDTDGSLVASGHPDLRVEKFRVESGPSLLGLVRSTNGGRTWASESLLGESDFHAFVVTADGILGADGTSGAVMASADGRTWERRGEVEALDLGVDPADDSVLMAVAFDGSTAISRDGGWVWEPVASPELAAVEWPEAKRIMGVGVDGVVYSATSPEGPWVEVSRLDGEPEALLAAGEDAWAALAGGAIIRSNDAGASWEVTWQGSPEDD